MVGARDLGGWLQGPGTTPSGAARRAGSGDGAGEGAGDGHPGARLGRPFAGAGSLAPYGRRLVGLCVDWGLALVIGNGVMRGLGWGAMAPLAALLVMHAVLVGTAGFSVGHRVAGLRVELAELTGSTGDPTGTSIERTTGTPPGLLRAVVRSALLCLAVPALLIDRDGRGLHDRAAGTAVVRR